MLRKSVLFAALPVCLGLSACGDSNTAPAATSHIASEIAGAELSLFDGAHGGSSRFYFLPPLVSNPKIGPANDRAIYPALTVTVCALNGSACAAGEPLVRYLPSNDASGKGDCDANHHGASGDCVGIPGIALDGNHYAVTWQSGDFATSTSTDYRVIVAASGVELGHVDVDLLAKNNETPKPDFVGLVQGAKLLIPFRIRQGVIASLTLSPADTSLTAGATMQFAYSAVDYSGNAATDRTTTWTSSDPSVATIDASGKVTAVGAGTTTITLDVEGHVATASVTVVSAATTFTVTPTSAAVTLGSSVTNSTTLTITAAGPNGPITSGLNPTWTADNANVTVAPANSGFTATVTGVTVGVSHITVSLAGLTPQAVTVSVNPAPNTAPAIDIGQNGSFVQVPLNPASILGLPSLPIGATYSFTSSDPSVAEVDPATGVVTPRADGATTITLTVVDGSGQIIGTQTISVNPPLGAACVEGPENADDTLKPLGDHVMHIFAPGEQLTTTVQNVPANAQSFSWTLGGAHVVTIADNGATATLTAGQSPGNVTLNVRAIASDGTNLATGVACLYVTGDGSSETGGTGGSGGITPSTPTRVVITPSTTTLSITDQGKGTLALHADVYDQNGDKMDASQFSFTWASGSPQNATVTASGTADALLQAQSATSTPFSITAAISGTSAAGSMSVTAVLDQRTPAPVPTTIIINPATVSLSIEADGTREQQTLTATVLDQNGQVMDASGLTFLWASPSGGVSVSSNGSATATITAQQATSPSTPFTVTAAIGTASGSTQVTVTDLRVATPPPGAPVVTPNGASCYIGSGQSIAFSATPPDGGSIMWTLSSANVLYFTNAPGSNGQVGSSVSLSCKKPVIGSIPTTGVQQTLSVVAKDANGTASAPTTVVVTIYPTPTP